MRPRKAVAAGLAAVLVLALCGCNRQDASRAPTDDPNYLVGYHNGVDDGRADVCHQIEHYKPAMAKELQQPGICPGPDSN
ncbi:MAG TPA: hypothetical protein VNU97_06585 [Rhizomicrobium sp.]|nr:hypothetical protein [Rhizomicrobium sp.]